ncbi:DUF4056 domain-containing protein [Erwinia sorbitola]|uniref:DUF4056 domain-containing protein n=1 Tax=Erwinia sorbitola TaxID=2681984 RepID=A0A6I6EXU6_9GAMM|nr:DUF4056 domain-containing protein [Erwinia sorbitola]MTD28467.1 DUF4056 domain-containing protein [Erwinia sorbitola]QGU86580.1 DUF4056 domain-containing protein [Erwinia sorbitola]
MKKCMVLLSLLLNACHISPKPFKPMTTGDLEHPATQALRVWPTISKLSAPNGLRPCCAFGYDVRAKLIGIPVPLFKLGNIVAPDDTGKHHYNDSWISILSTLSGINSEHDGIVYTRRGGFIDLAHVRDTADNTLWLFNQILPQLGQPATIKLDDELGQRIIRLWRFSPPKSELARYQLSVSLAAHLAFQIATWHEVAQWYGFQSVPGYSEAISAFSPEDLYSNLIGARIATDLLNNGGGSSLRQYQHSMAQMIPQALAQLQAVSPQATRFHFDMVDGTWWNSHCRVPDKFLVRLRNYSVSDRRLPSRPADTLPELWLTLPDHFGHQPLSHFGRLEIWQGNHMANLPAPSLMYSYDDFPRLAQQAEKSDQKTLAQLGDGCN